MHGTKPRPTGDPGDRGPLPGWRRLSGRPLVGVALATLLALALLYPDVLLQGRVFASSDAVNADLFRQVGDAALADGDYPQWNPYLFCGMPTFGSLAYTRFVYPPTALFDVLQQVLGFPPLTWLFAHLLFGALGMAFLLRRWRLPAGALVLGALAWILFPKVVAWAVHGHGSKLGAAMYIPWIVAVALDTLEGKGRRPVAVLALLLGLQLLRGHLQITYYTLLLVGWLALWFLVRPWSDPAARPAPAVRLRRLGWLAAGVAIAFAIGAVLLLPIQGYAPLSVRGAGEGGGAAYDYATGWSLSPRELATTVMPAAAGFGKVTYVGFMPFNDYPNYFGILLLVLAGCAWLNGHRLRWALLSGAVLAVLISFGRHFPLLYDLLYNHLPYFNRFRIPSMILVLAAFVAAALGALGVSSLVTAPPASGSRRRLLPLVLLGLGGAILLAGLTGLAETPFRSSLSTLAQAAGKPDHPLLQETAWDMHRADLVRIGLILAVAGSALLFAARNATFARRGLPWVLALLVAYDLGGVDRRIVHPETALREVVTDQTGRQQLVPAARLVRPYQTSRRQLTATAAEKELAACVGHERVWPLGSLAGQNDLMVAGIRSLGGYYPAKLAAYEEIRSRIFGPRPGGRLAAWLAGRWLLVPRELSEEERRQLADAGADLVPEPRLFGPVVLYENLAARPRARLVTGYTVAEDPGEDALATFLDRIEAGTEPVGTRIVLDRAPAPVPQAAAAPPPAPEFLRDGLDEVVLRTTARDPALLLLADMTVPGWKVEVDGRAAELLVADHVLRAVALPGGTHEVRFYYQDIHVSRGLTLTLAGLAAALALLLWAAGPFRRRASGSPAGEGKAGQDG